MSLEDEKHFWDMTPHRIRVTSTHLDDYGKHVPDPTLVRTYRCLVSDSAAVSRSMSGDDNTNGFSAWVLATTEDKPLGGPWKIWPEDIVEFIDPVHEVRPIANVELYYAEDGTLNNMTVRFS
jgi:hypothetical protein